MIASIVRFAVEVLGFPLHPRQAEILAEIYGDGIRVAVLRLGRRAGKGRMAAIVAVWEATVNAAAHRAAVRPEERVHIVVVARSREQARLVRDYISEFLRRPALAPLIARETADELELTNGIVIDTLPCNAASVRGMAIAVVIMDEAAWFAGVDGSPLDARELADALVPATAQFPERRMLVLSTPHFGWGWFADLCAAAESGTDPELRVWHATTAEMNPLIDADFLEKARLRDPATFAREFEAEFPAGVAAVLDPALVRAAVRADPDTLSPRPYVRYVIAIDPGFVNDAFALVLAHREGEHVIVDLVRGWHGTRAAPVQLEVTLDTIAELAKAYNGAQVITDQSMEAAILPRAHPSWGRRRRPLLDGGRGREGARRRPPPPCRRSTGAAAARDPRQRAHRARAAAVGPPPDRRHGPRARRLRLRPARRRRRTGGFGSHPREHPMGVRHLAVPGLRPGVRLESAASLPKLRDPGARLLRRACSPARFHGQLSPASAGPRRKIRSEVGHGRPLVGRERLKQGPERRLRPAQPELGEEPLTRHRPQLLEQFDERDTSGVGRDEEVGRGRPGSGAPVRIEEGGDVAGVPAHCDAEAPHRSARPLDHGREGFSERLVGERARV